MNGVEPYAYLKSPDCFHRKLNDELVWSKDARYGSPNEPFSFLGKDSYVHVKIFSVDFVIAFCPASD